MSELPNNSVSSSPTSPEKPVPEDTSNSDQKSANPTLLERIKSEFGRYIFMIKTMALDIEYLLSKKSGKVAAIKKQLDNYVKYCK